jgi:D-alanyl-D-alanine carboxypeptidase (penicillin-binding protein 5/6)
MTGKKSTRLLLAALVLAVATGLVSDGRADPGGGDSVPSESAGSAAAGGTSTGTQLRPAADTDTVVDPGEPVFPDVTGAAAIVIDRNTGAVLGAKNADLRWAPASTTKIMTALLAIEAINRGDVLQHQFIRLQDDVKIEGTAGVGLEPGDLVTLHNLLYLTLVGGGGDAATAIGTYVGGSRDDFIFEMNTRARELGLTNTSYVDISGRDPEDLYDDGARIEPELAAHAVCEDNMFTVPACAHYSTVRDLAKLARVALDEPLFAQIVGTRAWTPTAWVAQPENVAVSTRQYNSNSLVNSYRPDYYPDAYGVKTGTSGQAGENLVSAAERWVCDTDADCSSRDVIAVVVGSTDRYGDSRQLLEFGLDR